MHNAPQKRPGLAYGLAYNRGAPEGFWLRWIEFEKGVRAGLVTGGAAILVLGFAGGAFAQSADPSHGARVANTVSSQSPASVEALIAAGDFEAAERTARARLETVERAQGPRSAETAAALVALVDALYCQGRSRAPGTRALAERSAALHEELFGAGDLRLAAALISLGRVQTAMADFAAADSVLTRALEISATPPASDSLTAARALYERGSELQQRGRYDEALADLERALAIREGALPPNHPELARTLAMLGNTLSYRGDPAAGERLLRRALDITTHAGRGEHPHAGWMYNSLGNTLLMAGRPEEARASCETSLAIRQRVLRPTHPDLAFTLNNLANANRHMNNFDVARDYQLRAIEIAEQELGPEDPFVATCLSSLAGIYLELGSFDEALPLAQRAFAIRKKVLPAGHPSLGTSAHGLAVIADESGDSDLAVSSYREALAVYDKTLAPAHVSRVRVLWRLGQALGQRGELAAAESLCSTALALADSAFGPGEVETADIHSVLARILLSRGRFAEVRRHADQAVEVYSSAYGPKSREVASAQSWTAAAFAAEGNLARAFELALQVETHTREDVAAVSRALPERQALHYNARRPVTRDLLISIAGDARTTGESVARRAWDSEARSRAIVFDLMSARHRSLDAAVDPEARALVAQYEKALGDFANLLVRNVGGEEELAARIESARVEVERLERELAVRVAPDAPGAALATVGIDNALGALRPGSALVAYIVYDRLALADRNDPMHATPSYGAFIAASRDAAPVFVPIGRRAAIDSLVARWRAEAGRPIVAGDEVARTRAYRAVAAELRERIWDPVAARIGDATDLFVVPDADLNLVNFAALPEPEGRYLVESGSVIHLVGAERDLVDGNDVLRTVGTGLLALGDPDFDASPSGSAMSSAGVSGEAPEGSASNLRGERSRCTEFAQQRWRRLPATESEIADVAASQADVDGTAQVLSGAQATERAFKQGAPGRGILHVATHGFFLQGDCAGSDTTTRGMGRVVEESVAAPHSREPESPLLLSGLVFAGANRRGEAQGGDDGILTAEEIGACDLRGVKWVVLSACDTGLGDVQAGEGVFGLRRAFRIAGARSLVMSLWSVEDASTRAWMRDLYATQEAKQSVGAAEAVTRASRARIAARRAAGETDHPFYWAGFVATESTR